MPGGGCWARHPGDAVTARSVEDVKAIIRARSIVDVATGCWRWVGRTDAGGYGVLYWGPNGSAHRRAHRVSYAAFVADPGQRHVCHTCDTPACVNPEHLWLGTAADNHRDKAAKGRANPRRGEQHRTAKLCEADVASIRQRCADGESQHLVARAFGVSQPTISYIVRRTTWRHL